MKVSRGRQFAFNPAQSMAEIVIRVPIEHFTLDEFLRLKDMVKPPAVMGSAGMRVHMVCVDNGVATDYPAIAQLKSLDDDELRKAYESIVQQVEALE